MMTHRSACCAAALAGMTAAAVSAPAPAQPQLPPEVAERMQAMMGGGEKNEKDKEFPPFKEVVKDYEKVVSTADDKPPLYTIWVREKDGQMLAELPRQFEKQNLYIATTIAGGIPTAGIQFGEMYAYWKRFDKRLALIEPNLQTRTTGDAESKRSREQLFTDRVILDVPIVTMSPKGGPVIDMDDLLVGKASEFFGGMARRLDKSLATIAKAKAFPQNVELAFEAPIGAASSGDDGRLVTFHYSISALPKRTGYKPRKADERVGFFTTSYQDLAKVEDDTSWTRYINRWDLQKADPSLDLSPPKEPIVFYIEHTVPIRYRRWVREGILEWNKAFEKIGIVNAIEVYQQDARSGAHMDKDPEDVRYDFFRWNSNGASFAIGPSRVDPRTGQILDADIVMNDGWLRFAAQQWENVLPETATENFGPETLEWLDDNPEWDPRLRLLSPGERKEALRKRRLNQAERGQQRYGGHPAANVDPALLGDDQYDGLVGRISQVNGACMEPLYTGVDLAMMRMNILPLVKPGRPALAEPGDDDDSEIELPEDLPEEVKEMIRQRLAEMKEQGMDVDMERVRKAAESAPDRGWTPAAEEGDDENGDKLDGVPEWFVGPLIKDVTMHEVGHTLGLRHNFKASSIFPIEKINSEEMKGEPFTASVMDYNAMNVEFGEGEVQGEYFMPTIGPYDMWAIKYGYTTDKKELPEILKKATDERHPYLTDENTWGPDPLARRRDMGADPLEFDKSQFELVQTRRDKIIDEIVEDGDSWARARDAYGLLLGLHFRSISNAANWIGGSYVHRDKKGDPGERDPVVPVSAKKQREALDFVIDAAFKDEAYGLTSELLRKMSVDKWWDAGGMSQIFEDPAWDVHDQILGIQASAMTMVMNPTTLRRVYDNEFRIPSDKDALTLPELINTVSDEVWKELDQAGTGERYTARRPLISSLRRNLQREHVERLIDLMMPEGLPGAVAKPITTLATHKLREIHGEIKEVLDAADSKLDPYTLAHLSEINKRIGEALDAGFIYNLNDINVQMPAMSISIGAEERPERPSAR